MRPGQRAGPTIGGDNSIWLAALLAKLIGGVGEAGVPAFALAMANA